MRIIVLGGFLGSGKTSILLQLASYLDHNTPPRDSCSPKKKLVVLENEIGNEGIDDKLIRAAGYQVEVLTVGCICCLMLGTMVMIVEKILENEDPDWLIIEATGVADTTTVVRTLELRFPQFDGVSGVIVVDAARYDLIMNNIPGFLKGQLMHADSILINKVDLLSSDKLESIQNKVKSLMNGFARMFCVSAIEEIDHSVWKEIVAQNEELSQYE